mmetsp:Transcript_13994/g.44818  ORF Transcript_13994/g.44818 Transcript_13994/m.44818 type:complete len:727 (+) Transcript_13994:1536-3716(+)
MRELREITNAQAYCRSALQLARAKTTSEPTRNDLLALCKAHDEYRLFAERAGGLELSIGHSLLEQIGSTEQALRKAREDQLRQTLVKLHWPITVNNPSLNLGPQTGAGFESAIRELVSLQLCHQLVYNRHAHLIADSSEVVGRLWAVEGLAKPLLKRFRYHFSGSRSTNRIDKPDWFHGFMAQAVKDHCDLLVDRVQPIVEQAVRESHPSAFVDVLALFVRALIRGLHKHYESIWPSLAESDALVCHTVDEALSFDKTMADLYGYSAEAVGSWPRAVDFFLADQSRLVRWMDADLQFARLKVRAELDKPTAWSVLAATVGLFTDNSSSSEPPAPRLVTPECCDHIISILTSVAERAQAVPSPEGQLLFVRMVQLPLVEDFCKQLSELLAKEKLTTQVFTERGPAVLGEMSTFLNAAERIKEVLATWEGEPFYSSLKFVQDEVSTEEVGSALDSSSSHRVLDAAKRGVRAGTKVSSKFGGLLARVSAKVTNRIGSRGKFARESPRPAAAIEPSFQDSPSVLQPEIERLGALIAQTTTLIFRVTLGLFETKLEQYVHFIRRGGLCLEDRLPGPTPEFSAGLEVLASVLTPLRKRMVRPLTDRFAATLGKGVCDVLVQNVLDGCRLDQNGALQLEADFKLLLSLFAPFAKRPENRFFRPLKDRLRILCAASASLSSLRKTLLRLIASWDGSKDSPEGRQLTSILEDGYEVVSFGAQDALLLTSSRLDVK